MDDERIEVPCIILQHGIDYGSVFYKIYYHHQLNIKMTQPHRFLFLLGYAALLFIFNYLAFGKILPQLDEKSIWFFSGVVSLLLGKLLTSPYFTKPADSISYASIAFFALVFVSESVTGKIQNSIYYLLIFYYGVVILIGSVSILLKDSSERRKQQMGQTYFQLSELLGNQNAIFSSVAIFAIWVFHDPGRQQFYPTIAWAITAIQPHNFIADTIRKIRNIWKIRFFAKSIGQISSFQTPNILTVRQGSESKIKFGEVLAVKDRFSASGLAIALNYIGRNEELLLRGLQVPLVEELKFRKWKTLFDLPLNHVAKLPVNSETEFAIQKLKEEYNVDNIIGLVMQDSSIQKLYFEVINAIDLEVGRILEVTVGSDRVLYQLMNGLTKDEIIFQKNKYGYARGEALVVGKWNESKNYFSSSKWIPNSNGLVHIIESQEDKPTKNKIGHFPKSNYNIEISDVNSLVTHNTAILGILGIGKTMLAIELVDRITNANINVICIDLTNQYQKELKGLIDMKVSEKFFQEIRTVGEEGKNLVSLNVEEGGSVNQFKELLKNYLSEFVNNSKSRLTIINPSEFEVWRQDSKPYNNKASMVSLTPCEITSIISEATLDILQENGMSEEAKVCLVYEEAHSLVPEWSSAVNEGDKAATNATARSILQGRKYGMGCLLITQRTANVTKTILNQCNSIFAMRTFDDTGKAFLDNYIGSEYSGILPNLAEREAVFFGKASSCENPVLIRLNDRDKFLEAFYHSSQ